MPRITAERRAANRAAIIAGARRCFSRDGFHQTSMPDIAAAAAVSTGAPYRYFASKEEIILRVAGDAFEVLLAPLIRLVDRGDAVTVAELLGEVVSTLGAEHVVDDADETVPVEELLRCTVQAWAELLRHDALRAEATKGFERARGLLATALHRGREQGAVAGDLDIDSATRMIMALLHGVVLQRVAFDLDNEARDRLHMHLDTLVCPAGDA